MALNDSILNIVLKVRELMQKGCHEEIKERVPKSTWKYLKLEERMLR